MASNGIAGLLAALLALAVAAFLIGLQRRQLIRREAALIGQQDSLVRLLRLAANDQRDVALALLGHAQQSPSAEAEIGSLARRLLDLSESLTEQTEQNGVLRHLHEEEVTLLPVIEFAMAQVAALLGSGHRSWRLSPDLRQTRVLADRRAMNQVLVNVLAGAAAATRNGDLIELLAEPGAGEWSLIVQDEGVGLPVAANDAGNAGGRGIGYRLTLARSLMQAHDGALTVESAAQIGTRVRLSFPTRRVLA